MKRKIVIPSEVDLIVFGAGAAGMTAALIAALDGQEVLLCEASQQVGGTTATSAGTIWIPASSQSREAGFEDSLDEAMRYLDGLIPNLEGRELRHVYLHEGPAIIDEIQRCSHVKFSPSGLHPDYQDLPGSRVAGRALAPLPFDGRKLGVDFHRIRPPLPEFMVLGGMMIGKADVDHLLNRFKSWVSFKHCTALVLRYLIDRLRHARGTRLVMGNALVARFYASLKEVGVSVSFGTSLDELVLSKDCVTGAQIRMDGQLVDVKARKGVILATGGFGHDKALRKQLMPAGHDKWPSLLFEGNLGCGVKAAIKAGAKLTSAKAGKGVFWQPVSITQRQDGSKGLFPHLFLDRAKPGLIAVDHAGKRFTNEGNSYHYFCDDMIKRHESTPAIPCWVIVDSNFISKYGLGFVYPGSSNLDVHVKSGYLKAATTLEKLAQLIKVDAAGLQESVTRNNDFSRTGVDADYGKGSTEVSRFNGDIQHQPNPCLGAISKAPFYAMALWPGDAASDAGLATDTNGRVLNSIGQAISGLYACGNDMASVMSGSYPGPGATIGPALVFGYRVAKSATASN
jgi:succinate dehydrogenase/fumarate reductase flavoprotein subunit